MEISEALSCDEKDAFGSSGVASLGNWYGKGQVKELAFSQEGILARAILMSDRSSSQNIHRFVPMGGSANISVEKDSDGDTSASVEVEHTSDDGKVSVSGEVKIDQDGTVSGSASVGINWKD